MKMKVRNFNEFSLNEGTQGGGNKFIVIRFGNAMSKPVADYFDQIAVKNPKRILLRIPGAFLTMFTTALTKEALIQGFDQLGISYNLYQLVHTSAGGTASTLVARKPNKQQLEASLKKALAAENYELATKLRDQIAELTGHPAPAAGTSEGRVYSFNSFLMEKEEEYVNGTNTEEFHKLVSELVDHELAEIEGGEEEFLKETCEKIKDYLVQNKLYVAKEKEEVVKQEMNEADVPLETELVKYKSTFEDYCKEKKEDEIVHDRALELLDEIQSNTKPEIRNKFYAWLTTEKTLTLQELLRATTYNGNGNSPKQLRDFNAFALLDTVSSYNKQK
jgi:hypothetical protein